MPPGTPAPLKYFLILVGCSVSGSVSFFCFVFVFLLLLLLDLLAWLTQGFLQNDE